MLPHKEEGRRIISPRTAAVYSSSRNPHGSGNQVKRVYICGSFKFLNKIDELGRLLEAESLDYSVSRSLDANGIHGCLEKIDRADIVYIVNPDGYVGKSVSIDIGYAYARNRPIYAMCPVDDPPIMNLIKGVLSFEEFVNFLKMT
jgi:hypothetical protein